MMNIFNQSFKFLPHATHQDTTNLLAKSHSCILLTKCDGALRKKKQFLLCNKKIFDSCLVAYNVDNSIIA